ncbi:MULTISPECIES: winged helix-turn-helix domain-containing protein [unclassified Bradyrhizobium]
MPDKTPKDADFLTDAEIAVHWGVCDKTARRAMGALEKAGGFPRKDPLFGNKRYWPAVDAFMKRRAGLNVAPVSTPDGQENWD